MANRYWVGGTANWDATAGTKWALISGGAGGQAIPTSADDVFFDAASGAVTVTGTASSVCKNFDLTGFTGSYAGGTTIVTSVHGSLTIGAGVTAFGTIISFKSTTSGNTITTNGKSVFNVIFNGVGGVWTLQDNLTVSGTGSPGVYTVQLTNGTLDTNGHTVTAHSTFISTFTLTLGSSTYNATSINTNPVSWNVNGTLTLNAGTSTVNINVYSSASGEDNQVKLASTVTTALTYYNVNIQYTTSPSDATCYLIGACTFNNLTFNSSLSGRRGVRFASNITVNGTLTCTGASPSLRMLVKPYDAGQTQQAFPRTITAAAVSLTNVDFEDITAAGAAAPFTGTRLGNVGACSNITFTPASNKYWVGNSGAWDDATNHWATSSNGSPGVNNAPLPQDTAYFDTNSFTSNSRAVGINGVGLYGIRLPPIDCTGLAFTGTFTFGGAGAGNMPQVGLCGSVTLSNKVTVTGAITYIGRGVATWTSNGATGTLGLYLQSTGRTDKGMAPPGTFKLANNWTTADIIYNRGGYLDINGNTVTMASTNNYNSALGDTTGLASTTFGATGIINSTSGGSINFANLPTNNGSGAARCFFFNNLENNSSSTYVIPINVTYTGATALSLFIRNQVAGGGYPLTECKFDANISGPTGTVTLGNIITGNLNFTGFTGTWNPIITSRSVDVPTTIQNEAIGGNLTLSSGMSFVSGLQAFGFFLGTSGSGAVTVTSNGKAIATGLFIGSQIAPNIVVSFADNCTLSAASLGCGLSLNRGTMNLNGKTVTTDRFFSDVLTYGRTLTDTVGGGILRTQDTTAATVFDVGVGTNLTVTRTNPWTIEIGGNTANTRTFSGGGKTYPSVIFINTTANGGLNFVGNNTFKSLSATTPPQTIRFTAGSTTTIEDATTGFYSGTAGNLITIGSITASNHTLNFVKPLPTSVISSNYLSISRSTATPNTVTWYAGVTSTNGGNNSGWIFTGPPIYVGITGVTGTSDLGVVEIGRKVTVLVTGLDGTSSLQTVSVYAAANVFASGVNATTDLGNVVVSIPKTLLVSGVHGVGAVGTPIWWILIPTNQTPGWAIVPTTQNPEYAVISNTQTANWASVTTVQNPEYTSISTTQDPEWE